jgi:hypothetical protein
LVKVRFVDQDDRILPDMSARVAFLSKELSAQEQKPYTVVQASAIVMGGDQAHVFRINDATAHKTPVAVGKQWNDLMIVQKGLSKGDKVVINPPDKLSNGSHVVLESTD